MIQDFNLLPSGLILQTDLCIVGSGPAGIALAKEFEGSNLKVIVVESGALKLEAAAQALCQAESIGLPHHGHRTGRARAFGGTGKLWAGQCLRLDKIDFEQRSWVPESGWPFALETLAPFYQRAERFFRVSGEFYDERQYRCFHLNAPEWSEQTLRSMFTIYTPDLDPGDFSLKTFQQSSNINVLLNANVVQVETNPTVEKVESVRLKTLSGKQGRVKAPIIVLCAGGLENARLLMASNERSAAGLGNGHDLVGRYFQEHPNGITASVFTNKAELLQSLFRLLYRRRGRYFPKFALSEEIQRARQILNCNAHLVFEYEDGSGVAALQTAYRALREKHLPANSMECLGSIVRNPSEIARALWNRMRTGQSPAARPKAIRLQCYLEQSPNFISRVRLGNSRDALGMPILQVDWHLAELELKTLNVMTQTVAAEFKALGLGNVIPESWLTDSSRDWQYKLTDCAHHMGTTRMAQNPREGVTDSDGRVFGIDGLYIAGSSVFPTSGYANPTLTIVALAMRLADHLKQVSHRSNQVPIQQLQPAFADTSVD